MGITILWPTFALVALIFIVFLTMFGTRAGHIRRNPPTRDTFSTGEEAMRYFAPVEMPANNFRNLFEVPVLYFALVPLLLGTNHDNLIQVVLAWIFVALRYAHSFVHIGPKNVPLRALLFVGSTVILMAMWIGFAIDTASAQLAYDRATTDIFAA